MHGRSPMPLKCLLQGTAIALFLFACPTIVTVTLAQGTYPGNALERIRQTHLLQLGYRLDAEPFSYQSASGQPVGYSIAVCERIVEDIRNALTGVQFTVKWVPVTFAERFRALQMDKIDVLCGADTLTLSRRVEVAFSIPIFPGGIGALVRSGTRPGSIGESQAYTVMAGTTAEQWLKDNMRTLNGAATVTPVHDYELGVRALVEGKSDVLFGERAILISAARRSSPSHLTVVDRYFTYEPLALTIAKGDEKLRLLIDQALSHAYRNGEIFGLYSATFGEPDENTRTFFRWSAIPD